MALGTLAGLKTQLGVTGTDATRDDALTAILVAVESAILRLCHPWRFEPVTVTDAVLDAPWASNDLLLPVLPVRSVTSLYYNPSARGVVASFEATHLLTAGTDYQLVLDDALTGWAKAGRVRRLNRSVWGAGYRRPLGRLAAEPVPEPGAIKVTFAAGMSACPAEVSQALYLAAMLVYQRRAGAPVASESWNGASRSLAGPFTATAAVTSPDVYQLLLPYLSPVRVGGG